MSFGLSRGRQLDPGQVGLRAEDLGPLPDDILNNPAGAYIDPRQWFAEPARPLELEIGSGKGTFLVQQAAEQPGTNFLGVEWAHEFYAYAADRLRRRGLSNVKLLNADAVEFLRWRCPSGIARVIHLYFSDPWPKTRHHRRRVVQDQFLSDAWRVLEPGGELRIVTDHEEYWAWMEEYFARWCGGGRREGAERGRDEVGVALPGMGQFERLEFEPPGSAGEGELVGTNFERKYRREGRPFHSVKLRKIGAS